MAGENRSVMRVSGSRYDSLDYPEVGMARRFSRNGNYWSSVDRLVDIGISPAGRSSRGQCDGTEILSRRREKSTRRHFLGIAIWIPADMGFRSCKILDQPRLVVLALLVAKVF
jgi:hypothetical protein